MPCPVQVGIDPIDIGCGVDRAAQTVYLEIVDRAPDDIGAWRSLAALHREYGEHAEASEWLRRAHHSEVAHLAIDPVAAAATADFFLAADGYVDTPAAMPGHYVEPLFDRYADHFDDHLESLGYRAPQALIEALGCDHERAEGEEKEGRVVPLDSAADLGRVLDVGCGTGLAGALLRPAAERLEGVDLSRR